MTKPAWNFPPAPCAYCKAETTSRLGWPEPGDTDGLKPVDLRYRLNKGHSLEAALKMKPCKHGYKLKAE